MQEPPPQVVDELCLPGQYAPGCGEVVGYPAPRVVEGQFGDCVLFIQALVRHGFVYLQDLCVWVVVVRVVPQSWFLWLWALMVPGALTVPEA